MGRISYEEIGYPLPGRTTIVVSSTKKYNGKNCFMASSLKEAINIAGDRNVYISGGSRLYKEAIAIVDKMYITEIDAAMDGDTYFPEFQEENFKKKIEQIVDGEIPYTYITYTRKRTE